jgi:hypothetical protein
VRESLTLDRLMEGGSRREKEMALLRSIGSRIEIAEEPEGLRALIHTPKHAGGTVAIECGGKTVVAMTGSHDYLAAVIDFVQDAVVAGVSDKA